MSDEHYNPKRKRPANNSTSPDRRVKPNNKRNSRTTTKTMKNTPNSRNVKRKRKKKKSPGVFRFLIFLTFLLVLGITIGCTVLVNTLNKMDRVELDDTNLGITDSSELEKYANYDKIKNIALFGVDTADGSNGRSDAIMIATIDPVNDKIKLTSLMRDTYVHIDGHGYDKLNHAYAFGGPELAIKTINQNFGLNIKDFATVDFMSLSKVIDAIGGVDVIITDEEVPIINEIIANLNSGYGFNCPLISYPGQQTLNGAQALSYMRIRSTAGGDFERTQRQRTVMNSIFAKAKATSVSSYNSILNKIMPLIQTNMTTSDILSMGTTVLKTGGGSLEQQRFPLDKHSWGDYVNDIWYLMYDGEITKEHVTDYIFDDKSPIEE